MSMSSVLSDPELINAVRNGEISAYAGLYSRHAHAAHRLAGVLTHDRDDVQRLVSDSFAGVRVALLSGGGPAVIFRTYLLATLRDIHHDQLRRRRGLRGTSGPPSKEPLAGLVDATALSVPTGSLIAQAIDRLPARWQLVLWHVEVEREAPILVAPMLGLRPTEVSTLAARARDRLRSAYLTEMAEQALTADCSWAAQRLAAGVPREPFDPDHERLDEHISGCDQCHQRFAEFYRIERRMADVLGPLVLGGLADAYSSSDDATGTVIGGLSLRPRRWSRLSPRRWSRRRVPWVGLLSAAVAGVAAIVILSSLHLGSPVPARVTGSAAPEAVANTDQPTPVPSRGPAATATAADVTVRLRGTLVRGRSTRLQVQVVNAGPAASGTVTLVLTLPVGASLGGSLPGSWECAGRTTILVCSHPALASGDNATGTLAISVRLTAPRGGRVSAVVSPAVADPAGGNNRADTSVKT